MTLADIFNFVFWTIIAGSALCVAMTTLIAASLLHKYVAYKLDEAKADDVTWDYRRPHVAPAGPTRN